MFGLSAFAQAPFASLGTATGPNVVIVVATNVGVMSVGTVVASAGARIHEDISGLEATSGCAEQNTYSLITGQSIGVALTCSLKAYRVESNGNILIITSF